MHLQNVECGDLLMELASCLAIKSAIESESGKNFYLYKISIVIALIVHVYMHT